MGSPDFWNSQESAQQVVQQVKTLKGWVDPFEGISARIQSGRALSAMLDIEPDVEMEGEVAREVARLGEELEEFRLRSLLSHPDDFRDALVAVDVAGLSYEEAARTMGVPEGTLTSRLFRARDRVARRLSEGS